MTKLMIFKTADCGRVVIEQEDNESRGKASAWVSFGIHSASLLKMKGFNASRL